MQIKKFEKEYDVKSYECDKNGGLRLLTLMNIFQDIADSHASALGIGIEHCLAHGLAWIGSNYIINIERLPQWHEKIRIVTWPAVEKKIGAVRDFLVFDEKGLVIIRASSQWVLINYEKRRPVSLRDNLPEYHIIDERALFTDFPKIEDFETVDFQRCFAIRFDDIDINNHVNNSVYPLWASEAVPAPFRLSHRPETLEVAFKKEGLFGEDVNVLTRLDGLTSLHSIQAQSDGRELAKVKIVWKEI